MQVSNVTTTSSFDVPDNGFNGSNFGNPPSFLPLGSGASFSTFIDQNVGAVTNPSAAHARFRFYAAMQS